MCSAVKPVKPSGSQFQTQGRDLAPGIYSFEIDTESLTEGLKDPVAYVWLRNPEGQAAIIDEKGKCHSALWHKLNGYQQKVKIQVNAGARLETMCTERDGFDQIGQVKILPHPKLGSL